MKMRFSVVWPTSWKQWAPHPLTFASAAMIVFAFPPWNLWPLLWICLIPWFYVLKRTSQPRQALIQGLWLGYFMSLGGFYWIAFAIQEFGNLHWILAGLGLQFFCLVGQPHFLFFAFLFKKLKSPKGILFSLNLGLFFVGLEWLLPKMFSDTLGHGFYIAENLRQAADLGGARLLTFVIFFVNHALWGRLESLGLRQDTSSFSGRKFRTFFIQREVIVALGLIVSLWTYGVFRKAQITRVIEGPLSFKIQGAAIQGNIGDFDKIAAERGVAGAARKVVQLFMQLTEEALTLSPRPQFVIWPETAYPTTFRNPNTISEVKLDDTLEQFIHHIQVPLLFGGYDREKRRDFNAFFFLSPQGQLQTYRKNILLHFGEYIPGAESFQFLKDAFPQVGNFGRGVGPEILSLDLTHPFPEAPDERKSHPTNPRIRVSPIICYEVLFPNYVIQTARQNSQLIVNITNDSWFGSWGEPQLHLALSVFRSIETRIPMLRTTNTGISALISADGTIQQPTELGTQKILNVSIPITPPIPSWIKTLGDGFGPLALILSFLGLIIVRLSKR